jgi:hypothetical protein
MATLPEATRLLVFKADGSVLVHDDQVRISRSTGSEGVPPEGSAFAPSLR